MGLLLSDAHINRSNEKAYFTIEQTAKHSNYVFYLYNLLKAEGLLLHPIKYYSRSDVRYNSVTSSIYFKSYNLENLKYLADMFIFNGKKIIPINIKDHLTPISLAHWICGDGQLVKNGGITLCTDNYTLVEVNILIDSLKEIFNADCSIHNKKAKNGNIYYRIYIKKHSFEAIKALIIDHVHESRKAQITSKWYKLKIIKHRGFLVAIQD